MIPLHPEATQAFRSALSLPKTLAPINGGLMDVVGVWYGTGGCVGASAATEPGVWEPAGSRPGQGGHFWSQMVLNAWLWLGMVVLRLRPAASAYGIFPGLPHFQLPDSGAQSAYRGPERRKVGMKTGSDGPQSPSPNTTSPFWRVMAFITVALFTFACWIGKVSLEEMKGMHDSQIHLEEGMKQLNESMNNYDMRMSRTEDSVSDIRGDLKVVREEVAELKVRTRNLR